MSPEARVRDTVARVRALVRQFSAPDPALLRLTADADAHVAALQPPTTLLEPTGFEVLSRARPDERAVPRPGASGRRRRNTAADPDPHATRRSGTSRSAFMPDPTVRPSASGAHRSAWEDVVPGTDNRRRGAAARGGAADAAPAHSSAGGTTLPPGIAGAPGSHDNRRPGSAAGATAATRARASGSAAHVSDARPVDVGRLADRVRARTAVAGAARGAELHLPVSASRPTLASDHATSHHESARIALPIGPLPVRGVRAPGAPTQMTARSDTRSRADVMTPDPLHAAPASSSEVRDGAATRPRSPAAAMQFLFDPFAQSSAGEPSDEMLGARVETLLREQARRHGVDLT